MKQPSMVSERVGIGFRADILCFLSPEQDFGQEFMLEHQTQPLSQLF